LDFGATREYSYEFISDYLEVVGAAAKCDRDKILLYSKKYDGDSNTMYKLLNILRLGFLTGEESQIMNDAHCGAVLVLGEPFVEDVIFNFEKQQITKRIHSLIPIMLKNRLTPPPQESV
jgi:aarF domain-containing kinase